MKVYPECNRRFQFYCKICKRLLNDPSDPTTKDCGGDCLRCMAECGYEDCQSEMDKFLSGFGSLDEPKSVGNGESWFDGGGI